MVNKHTGQVPLKLVKNSLFSSTIIIFSIRQVLFLHRKARHETAYKNKVSVKI